MFGNTLSDICEQLKYLCAMFELFGLFNPTGQNPNIIY